MGLRTLKTNDRCWHAAVIYLPTGIGDLYFWTARDGTSSSEAKRIHDSPFGFFLIFFMDQEFGEQFLGISRPAELAATDIDRPLAPSTGGRGTARIRPAANTSASGRREGLGDAMLEGLTRNDERREVSRRDRDLDTLIASQKELSSNVQQLASLISNNKKGVSVSARKASLFPGVDTDGFSKLLMAVRTAGPVRTGGGNASLHFRRLLIKYCHTKGSWSYDPRMRKRLAMLYFQVLQSCHAEELTRFKVDTLTESQTKMFVSKFMSSVVDHNICQWKSHIKGKIKEGLCIAFGVPKFRCPAVEPDDHFTFDLMIRNTKVNHSSLKYVVDELFGETLRVLGADDGNCDDFISFMFHAWNEVRNWSGYGASAPSVDDIAWVIDIAEEAFTELQSDDAKQRRGFLATCANPSRLI